MNYSLLHKGLPILAVLCLIEFILFGQKTEIKVNAYSGLFSFYGSGSASASTGYLNPAGMYGRKKGFSYSFELQAQRVTNQKHLFGLGISAEKLKSTANSTLYVTDIITGIDPGPTEIGETRLSNSFINLNPFVGQRFFDKAITLDALVGFDLAYWLKSKLVIKMFNTNRKDFYSFAKNEIAPSVDVRPRAQFSANYKQLSLLVGYSLGLTDYSLKLRGYETRPDSKAYASFLRMGISYKFR